MTQQHRLHGGRHADTEVFYMAGRQLGALGRNLGHAGWPADTPVSVVSRAGWPDALASDHRLADLAGAAVLHAGRPTVVTVGVGAAPVAGAAGQPAAARKTGGKTGGASTPHGAAQPTAAVADIAEQAARRAP